MNNQENAIRTKEAQYNLKIARKNGSVIICQTLQGNVMVEHNEGIYTVTKMLKLEDYIKDENAQAPVLASGSKKDVIETIKSVFEIIQ